MTTELEEQFFKVFGIEPKIYETDGRDIDDNGDVCSWYIEEIYPEITDRKLLEMICILNSYYTRTMQCCTMLYSSSIASLEEEILKEFIDILKQYTELEFLEKDRDERKEEDWIKTNIQQLFKEEE